MKNYIRKILQYAAVFAGLIIIYTVFLMAGELIPRRLMTGNAMKSYSQLKSLGLYFEGIDGADWDNWTDSYFINSAVTEYNGNLLQKAMANAYTAFDEPDDSGSVNVINNIKAAVKGGGVVESYSRYWVGMLTIYKLLLIFMPINGIRTLVFGIAVILFALSAICVYKRLGAKGLVPYLVSVVIAQYMPQAMCLVFNTDISIMFLMMVICCIMLDKKVSAESFYMLFFLAGSILAYLNYWAFPLITLGFPLVFVITVKLAEEHDIRSLTKETVFMSVSWGAGLAGTVLAKQILCKIVLGMQSGTDQLLVRMGSEFTITGRFISVINGLVRRMTSAPVLVLTVVLAVWLIVMLKTGSFKRQYRCFLLIMTAFYPIIWWFLLPNHCIHGFVKHMYGVTYYALLSAVLINCQKFVIDFRELKNKVRNRKCIAINAAALVLWFCMSCVLFRVDIHYGAKETEPWSLEVSDTIRFGRQNRSAAVQEMHFDNFTMLSAYLNSISTILVNLPEDKNDGILHVELSENGSMIGTSDVQISDIAAGEWFRIPFGCIVELGHEYQITYTVRDNEFSEPYLLVQDKAQAVGENDTLYIDGVSADGAIVNKYEYDEFILPVKAKVCIVFIILMIIEYGIYLFEMKNFKNEEDE